MKIVVDRDLCEANTVCVQLCPEVFSVDDDDVLHVDESAVTPERREEIEEAVRLCPRGALSLED